VDAQSSGPRQLEHGRSLKSGSLKRPELVSLSYLRALWAGGEITEIGNAIEEFENKD